MCLFSWLLTRPWMTRNTNKVILNSHFHTRKTLSHPQTWTISSFPSTFEIVDFKAETQKHEHKMNLELFFNLWLWKFVLTKKNHHFFSCLRKMFAKYRLSLLNLEFLIIVSHSNSICSDAFECVCVSMVCLSSGWSSLELECFLTRIFLGFSFIFSAPKSSGSCLSNTILIQFTIVWR